MAVTFLQHLVGLRQLAGDVDHDRQGRLARRRRDQADADVAAGHALHVVQRQSQPLVDARPAALELPADVLRERLHHRIGHQVAELGLVPVLAERVDVGDGEESLRGVGQQRLAEPAFFGPCLADTQQQTANPAKYNGPRTRHGTTPCRIERAPE